MSNSNFRKSNRYFIIVSAVILMITAGFNCSNSNNDSNNDAKNPDRVELAIEEKKAFLTKELSNLNIDWQAVNIFIRGFKQEKILEIWVKNKEQATFQKLLEYDFCKLSGELGPKRKEGDFQVPEGFYKIDRFNPQSSYYLSLGINYPNKSDKIRGDKNKPGSDIFIHGNCVTVGCIPITDDKIKELYILAKQANSNGQDTIHVNIYPARLTHENIEYLKTKYQAQIDFWKELKVIYDQFEKTKQVPDFLITDRGEYESMQIQKNN